MLNDPSNSYPVLSKSYKGAYPFKPCAPSFIYPDHYVPNVKLLGAFVDEIPIYQTVRPLHDKARVKGMLEKGEK